MKENCTIAKPHLVENFIQDLMSEHTNKGDNVTFTKVASICFLFLVHSFLLQPVSFFLFAHLLSLSIVHHAAGQAICPFCLCLFADTSFQLIYFFIYSSVEPSIIFSPKTYIPFIFPSIYSLLASQPYKWCSRDEIFLSFLRWNLINLR